MIKDAESKLLEIFVAQKMDWIKASVILKEAIERGISEPTVFRWLKKLTKDGLLENKRGAYKDSQYRINPKKIPKSLWEETVLKFEMLSLLNGQIREFQKTHSQEDTFKELAQWLGALTLFTTFVAVQKGRESLLQIPAYYISEGAEGFIRRPIAYRVLAEIAKTGTISDDKYLQTLMFYQHPSLPLEEKEIVKPALNEIRKTLEQSFGEEKIQQLQNTFDKVLREGKSPFQLSSEKV